MMVVTERNVILQRANSGVRQILVSFGISMNETKATERKSALILAAIVAIEGTFVLLNWLNNGQKFVAYLGFSAGKSGTLWGWILALVVTVLFVALSIRLPSVRANLLRPTWLKALGLAVAVSAGILEELVFRKLLMNYLLAAGVGSLLQIVLSGLAFGAAHGIWGLMGRSVRAALGATVATGLLGAALAIVFIVSGRSLAPCIAAHFLINALIEPGLVLAVTRGEMTRAEHKLDNLSA
ncbi:MAG: CPBP family intramembrane metalloprotease [Acidobacteria bacterium]|nr:MAG: CPBP family intramembrane metalloprotease [Acidobacteriota bacterium]